MLRLGKTFGAGDFRDRGVVPGLFSFDEVGALKSKLGLPFVNSTVGAESSGSEYLKNLPRPRNRSKKILPRSTLPQFQVQQRSFA